MRLTKFGIVVKKTTSLFTSIRDSKISRGCAKTLKIPEGRGGGVNLRGNFEKSRGEGGHMANPFHGGWGGGMDIFWNHTFRKPHGRVLE